MKYIKNLLLTGGLLVSALQALPWGQKGHDTVAYIAECHLDPEVKATAEKLLGGHSIVYYSNWLDNASHTPEYAYSKTWHYKNIDPDETFESAKLNPDGDIVSALESNISILSDTTIDDKERSLALKMVIHFLGDIHQPMHLGRAKDLGGNRRSIRFFRNDSNLHSVWDSKLVEAGHKWSYTEWQQQIDRAAPAEEMEITSLTTPTEWARETYELARSVYDQTPENYNVEYTYIAKWTPVVESQFLKGGLRLAMVLNKSLSQVNANPEAPTHE